MLDIRIWVLDIGPIIIIPWNLNKTISIRGNWLSLECDPVVFEIRIRDLKLVKDFFILDVYEADPHQVWSLWTLNTSVVLCSEIFEFQTHNPNLCSTGGWSNRWVMERNNRLLVVFIRGKWIFQMNYTFIGPLLTIVSDLHMNSAWQWHFWWSDSHLITIDFLWLQFKCSESHLKIADVLLVQIGQVDSDWCAASC